jgi:two-component system sensor histidine kinase BaeS
MKWTVRAKIFFSIGLAVIIVVGAHAVTKQAYMASLFDQFLENKTTAAYLRVSTAEQIGMLKAYVSDKMQAYWLKNWLVFMAFGLLLSYGISGMLTAPLRRLMAAIERVARGDLDVRVPVQADDEYGKVIRTFNDMTRRLKESEEVRRRLVADVAHELRTPLSIVRLKLENAQQAGQPVPPETLLRIHDEVIRLGLLVDDLHDLSLAEAGRLTLDLKPIDLAARLEQIVEDVKMEGEENGLAIRFAANARPAMVTADARRITQVFINLLTNAIRYTPAGGTVAVELADRARHEGADYARVSVRDTGIVIPAGDLPHLFDRFYRVEKDRSRDTGGSGLGLSIAHHWVKAHGGFIRVESEPGKGTEFTVFLPLPPRDGPPPAPASPRRSGA